MPTPQPLTKLLSHEARILLDRLSRDLITAVFDVGAATELIDHEYAARSTEGLYITAAGMTRSRTP